MTWHICCYGLTLLCTVYGIQWWRQGKLWHIYTITCKKDNITGDLNSPTADNNGCAKLKNKTEIKVPWHSLYQHSSWGTYFYRTFFIKTLFLCNYIYTWHIVYVVTKFIRIYDYQIDSQHYLFVKTLYRTLFLQTFFKHVKIKGEAGVLVRKLNTLAPLR